MVFFNVLNTLLKTIWINAKSFFYVFFDAFADVCKVIYDEALFLV